MIAHIIDIAFLCLLGAGAIAGIAVFLGIVIAVLLSDWGDDKKDDS